MFTQIKLTADAYEQPPNHYHMIEVNLVEVKGGGGGDKSLRVEQSNGRLWNFLFCISARGYAWPLIKQVESALATGILSLRLPGDRDSVGEHKH